MKVAAFKLPFRVFQLRYSIYFDMLPFLGQNRGKKMQKYPMLRGLAGVAKFGGWIGIIGSVVMAIAGGAKMSNNVVGPEAIAGVLMLGCAAIIFALCAIMVVVGEVVQVFIDTEANTSRAIGFLEKLAGSGTSPQRSELRTPERVTG